jgi:hypothetical protein
MFDTIDKLLRSNGTLVLLGVIITPYLIYTLVSSAPVKQIIPHSTPTKTLEEIIQGSPTNIRDDEPWDNDFKSAIIEEIK